MGVERYSTTKSISTKAAKRLNEIVVIKVDVNESLLVLLCLYIKVENSDNDVEMSGK